MHRATGIYAPPGTGKTLSMQLRCTAAAIGKPWLGLPVRQCKSVLLYCEGDLKEMHERQDAITRFYGVTFDDVGQMRWLPRLGEDNIMMTFEQCRGTTTTLFHNLLGEVKAFGAQLVIFDTLSDEPLCKALAEAFDFSDPDLWRSNSFASLRPRWVVWMHSVVLDLQGDPVSPIPLSSTRNDLCKRVAEEVMDRFAIGGD